jgi:hypothetical protein
MVKCIMSAPATVKSDSDLTQGYLVMALGPKKYVEMAANLAASIRIMDPGRHVCLVHDQPVPQDIAHQFADFAWLETDDRYPHVMNKLRVFDISPYDQTMFVDADCLMVKRDADDIWRRAAEKSFSVTGDRRTSGEWKGLDIAALMAATGASYVVQMNSGVFYFDKSAEAKEFFAELNDFYLARKEEFGGASLWGKTGQTDEIYLGIVMGLRGMNTENMRGEGRNSWMVSTWRAFFCIADFRGRVTVFKAGRFLFGKSYLPTRCDVLSPTFLHFIGLKPRWLYDRLVRKIANAGRLFTAPTSA